MITNLLIYVCWLFPIQDLSIEEIRLLGERGRIAEAEQTVDAILSRQSEITAQKSLFQLGLTWVRELRFESALWMFERFYKAYPEKLYALESYALCLRQSGRYEDAVKIYEEAIVLYPKTGGLRNEQALLFQAKGDFERAKSGFREAFSLGTKESMENLAVLLRLQGDSSFGRQELEEVLKLDSTRHWSRKLYGFVRLDHNQDRSKS